METPYVTTGVSWIFSFRDRPGVRIDELKSTRRIKAFKPGGLLTLREFFIGSRISNEYLIN
jgi:hypothetical protein